MTIDRKKLRRCYAATKKYYKYHLDAKFGGDEDEAQALWDEMDKARELAFGERHPTWLNDAVNIVASRAVYYGGDAKPYQTLYRVFEALGCELVGR